MAQNEPNQTRRAQPIRNLWIVLLVFCFQGLAYAGDVQWQRLESEHAIIQYQRLNDLQKFYYRLNPSGWRCFKELFSTQGRDDLLNEISQQVDTLFEQVQSVLGIQREPERVTIRLYQNREQLNEAYAAIYGKPREIRAWYGYRSRTIFLNTGDVYRGMLSHELCHHLLDCYFLLQIPPRVGETMARMVELRLE